ncbi:hypothetical protein L202_06304 [Cryptococcus amylolentus CBS 6039]|uniref:Uncharacterized protein n=1 Tax=Cryptococcus amylolentus CBS 6039 TaxID=1295533 RepID=A0A1E3HFF7_9TREE|nr:hypothetical protein L202_06304 [Cryptococcus amylolentus CBS 6039]ODN75089.1 hypothetical protein L202_06304 [Cryptococcus amylolentus CBS 6039]
MVRAARHHTSPSTSQCRAGLWAECVILSMMRHRTTIHHRLIFLHSLRCRHTLPLPLLRRSQLVSIDNPQPMSHPKFEEMDGEESWEKYAKEIEERSMFCVKLWRDLWVCQDWDKAHSRPLPRFCHVQSLWGQQTCDCPTHRKNNGCVHVQLFVERLPSVD